MRSTSEERNLNSTKEKPGHKHLAKKTSKLVWIRYRKRKYVIDLRLLTFIHSFVRPFIHSFILPFTTKNTLEIKMLTMFDTILNYFANVQNAWEGSRRLVNCRLRKFHPKASCLFKMVCLNHGCFRERKMFRNATGDI